MIRPAVPSDVSTIFDLVVELARYERLLDQVTATREDLATHLFGERRYAEALLAEDEGKVVGFALFFPTYSTFVGRPGLYLEDIFVLPEYRRRGHGFSLLRELARIASERGCGRLEWAVLNWNEPAIAFYRRLDAKRLDEWGTFRMTRDGIAGLARGVLGA
jgi:GNAT superfamily N-acetyltransferase